jgi:uncharacterized protein (TIGR03435 family)
MPIGEKECSHMSERVMRILSLCQRRSLNLTGIAVIPLTIAFGVLSANRVSAQSAVPNSPHSIVGNWQGMFSDKSRIVFRILKAGDGWRAVVYFLDSQAGYPSVVPSVSFQSNELSFTSSGSFRYTGKLSADGNSLDGTFTPLNNPQGAGQKSAPLALPMVRATSDTAWMLPANDGLPPLMASTADPSFEVATIKPHDPNVRGGGWEWKDARRFQATMSVSWLIEYVYGISAKQLVNEPQWADKDIYDFAGVPDMPGTPTEQQRIIMMRKLLEERFNLKVHTEKRELAAIVLSPAKGGSKLMPSVLFDPGAWLPMRLGPNGGLQLGARNTSMGDFIRFLQPMLDRPVLDQTGLTGQFDFDLTFMPDDSIFGGNVHLPPSDNPPPQLFTAMPEQLGLKLTAVKQPVDVIVIDRLDRPTPN